MADFKLEPSDGCFICGDKCKLLRWQYCKHNCTILIFPRLPNCCRDGGGVSDEALHCSEDPPHGRGLDLGAASGAVAGLQNIRKLTETREQNFCSTHALLPFLQLLADVRCGRGQLLGKTEHILK